MTSFNVSLIAKTETVDGFPEKFGMVRNEGVSDSETLIEFAGRNCYRSFNRPNPGTRNTADYLANTLLSLGHWSIAEHVSLTFLFENVSRSFLTELERHRHLSFSVQSQRYVNESEFEVVIPPAIRDSVDPTIVGRLEELVADTHSVYEGIFEQLKDEGLGVKQAREAARCVLPNSTPTNMVVSGNLRAWLDVVARRVQPDADAEMREVMTAVLGILVGEFGFLENYFLTVCPGE